MDAGEEAGPPVSAQSNWAPTASALNVPAQSIRLKPAVRRDAHPEQAEAM